MASIAKGVTGKCAIFVRAPNSCAVAARIAPFIKPNYCNNQPKYCTNARGEHTIVCTFQLLTSLLPVSRAFLGLSGVPKGFQELLNGSARVSNFTSKLTTQQIYRQTRRCMYAHIQVCACVRMHTRRTCARTRQWVVFGRAASK